MFDTKLDHPAQHVILEKERKFIDIHSHLPECQVSQTIEKLISPHRKIEIKRIKGNQVIFTRETFLLRKREKENFLPLEIITTLQKGLYFISWYFQNFPLPLI